MKCPHCNVAINANWKDIVSLTDHVTTVDAEGESIRWKEDIGIRSMDCPNEEECGRLIVRGITTRTIIPDDTFHVPVRTILNDWYILPRHTTRPVDPLVPAEYAKKYKEAATILEDSPDASAGLSRRILADILKDKGKYDQYRLSSRIDAFIKDPANPRSVKENLNYLKQLSEFGVHTQKDEPGIIIEVSHAEAEWCLNVLDSLFEYYIVSPHHNEAMRSVVDEKLEQAGLKAIEPLPDDD